LNDDGAYVGFRMHVPASRDVCNELDAGNTWGASDIEVERARSVCSEGRTLEVLTWVFLGGAILAGGAGAAVLLGLGARREREPRADLDVTPHGATIGATVPF